MKHRRAVSRTDQQAQDQQQLMPASHRSASTGFPRQTALRYTPVAAAVSAILAGAPQAHAQEAAAAPEETGGLTEVVVTAQKVTENVQSVPVSIQVLNTKKIEELAITNLDDYVKYMPSVAYSRGQGQGSNGQPGASHVYMRGVVSGANENHSGSQPSVGTYLDEQPVTTIDGTPDIHVYDIQRIEVLEGPQGTLYGASSEAGTIRIITNKPDPTKFEAGYDIQGNKVQHGGFGWQAEGFVNFPLSPIAAIRLVAWDQHDAGYIDNVAGTDARACIINGVRTFPTWSGQATSTPMPCPTPGVIGAGAISNAAYVKKDYNTADTKGGRAALKLDIDDFLTITPSVMGQSIKSEGFFAYDPQVGDLQVTHFGPESSDDQWIQAALTAEGKFSDFDVVYAGAFMKRTTHAIADYSDYSEFYDRAYGSGALWQGDNGLPIMPQELVNQKGYFQKWSHELRLTTPQDLPVRGTAGVFIERQLHDIFQQYVMPGYGFTNPHGDPNSPTPNPAGFASSLSIPTLANTIWLTDEQRVDRDKAVFFQGTVDIFKGLSLTGGLRYFKYQNSLQGFYGYSAGYNALSGYSSGMVSCFASSPLPFAPCEDLDKTVEGTGKVPRVNLTYKFSPDALIYATWSKGFRPGGVNRTAAAGIGPYQADFLSNYEFGWKTEWFDHHLRWNGAIFKEDWNNFQFSFLGPNSVTIIANAGNARIKGIENELLWVPSTSFTLSANFTFLDPRLTNNYCLELGVTNCPTDQASIPFNNPNVLNGPLAPRGTNLPISPKFKGNMVARYTFDNFADWKPYGQASWVYQSQSTPSLRVDNSQVMGIQRAYGLLDLSAGVVKDNMHLDLIVTNVADRRAQLTRFVQCTVDICDQPYIIPSQPRTIAIQFGQRF